jgi:hypothetical protein
MVEDEEIAVNPDARGLLSILDRHGAELHALFCRLTLRADAAEDLLQDLFLKLRSSAGFARADNRKGYVFVPRSIWRSIGGVRAARSNRWQSNRRPVRIRRSNA